MYIIPKVDINGNPTTIKSNKTLRSVKEFSIYVPYKDASLYQFVNSSKLDGKYFYFNLKIKSFTKDSAIILAKEKIEKDSLIKPSYTNKKSTENPIETNFDKVIIIESNMTSAP